MHKRSVQYAPVTGEQLGLAFVLFLVVCGLVWAVVWAIWKGPEE